MTGYDVADPSLAEQGARRVAWAERAMPVLGLLRERFGKERPLAGMTVAACMHVTPETAALVRVLAAGGAQVHLAASNPLSTQDDVAAALAAEGVGVFARHGVTREGYVGHLRAVLSARPQLLLDDGCDLVDLLHQTPALRKGVKAGIEETTTGVLRLRQMAADGALKLPMVAVNDTAVQRLVANRHGTGQSTVDAVLRATGVLLAGTTVVIAGYGPCGVGIAERARGLGARVVVTEIEPGRALEAVLDGHEVTTMEQAAGKGDVFITATGNRDVLRAEHFAVMKDGAVLANAGHFDVEVDVRALATESLEVHRRVRPHVDEHLMPDGRRLLLVAEGRLVNLAAAEGHPAAVMDVSFAVQALTLEWLTTQVLKPGVHEVPAAIDAEVARTKLAALGVALESLTPEQQRYLSSWRP
ncbi:MAG: adenosylhomocysteinase [Frankiales bacterium]|jgi:adenosylhomocysteinase|nr:adenosylhomocysteinase [Frankiales bacterium]